MSDDLVKRLREYPLRECREAADRIEKLEAALHQWDHLIAHQFPYSRAAMSSMTEAAQITAALLHGAAPWPETRVEKLEAALREIAYARPECCCISDAIQGIARQARIDKLEGLLRFLIKNGQIRQASINVVQSILKEGDDNE
jgi:hypothetical protein